MFDIKPVLKIKTALVDLNSFLEGSKIARTELKKIQLLLEPKKRPLRLIKHNSTRWSSRFNSLERLLRLKTIFKQNYLFEKFPEMKFAQKQEFWENLEKIMGFIKYFKISTE